MKTERTVVVEADHYREEVRLLCDDPIIHQLAKEIPDGFDLCKSGMAGIVLREYTKRGGKLATSIGGPLRAVKFMTGTL